MQDIITEFEAALSAKGYAVKNGKVEADGHFHRLIYMEERESSGRYKLTIEPDGFAYGTYGSEKDTSAAKGFHPWHSKMGVKDIDPEERKAIDRRIKEARKAAEDDQEREWAEVAAKIRPYWEGLEGATAYKYLTTKKILPHGSRVDWGKLIIPMLYGGEVWSVQVITEEGEKLFAGGKVLQNLLGFDKPIGGGRTRGCYYLFADHDDSFDIIIICEGFSTGASIREACGQIPVFCAFTAGNLLAVGMDVRKKHPNAAIIFAADNDSRTGNIGKIKAEQAAVKIKAHVVMPEFPADDPAMRTDMNDLAVSEGPEAVCALIMTVVDQIPEPAIPEPVPFDDRSYESDQNSFTGDMGMPFRVLGYNHNTYYYYPFGIKQIIALSPAAHTMSNLLQLASLAQWESVYSRAQHNKIPLLAQDTLFEIARRKGIFSEEDRVRGVGAWIDSGRIVLHCGDSLYIDGVETAPEKIESYFTYVAGLRLFKPSPSPLGHAEARALRTLCEMPTWENKLSGSLLAGWIVVAQVCSMLEWRPHIWVTGQSGSGKSTVVKNIILPAIGKIAFKSAGGTTEPSLREKLGYDGRPVIYDEGEGESQKDKNIMADVIMLSRKASDGQPIGKYGQRQFIARSCFCFSAINPPLKEHADESRISLMVLKKNVSPTAREDFAALKNKIAEIMTPDFSQRLLARTTANLPALLDNIKTFEIAANKVIKGARASDQIAPMLAGLYMLGSTGRITEQAAIDWVASQEWEFHTNIKDDPDPVRLLHYISTSLIKCVADGATHDLSIGELIVAAIGKDTNINQKWADRTLRQHGIAAKLDGIYIANRNKNLGRILKETAWSTGESGWGRTMGDMHGAEKIKIYYFGPGDKQRATRIPLDLFYTGSVYREEEYEIAF